MSVWEKGHGAAEGKAALRAYEVRPYHTRVNTLKMKL